MLDEKVGVERSDAEMIDSESWREHQLISKEREACITAMSGGENTPKSRRGWRLGPISWKSLNWETVISNGRS